MMIEFTSDGSMFAVHLNILPGSRPIMVLKWDCGSDWAALLMVKHASEKLRDKIKGIRKNEYSDGYRTGRSKRGKKDWFQGWF